MGTKWEQSGNENTKVTRMGTKWEESGNKTQKSDKNSNKVGTK